MNQILYPVYFDNASKTIPYTEVLDCFNNTYKQYFANPSSIHFEGVKALRAVDKAKEEICSLLKMKNHNVIFTSNATESNNLAIKGFVLKYKNRGKHLICSQYEHASVLETMQQLEKEFGFEVTYLKPNSDGVITVDNIVSALRNDTILVSIMTVNNEIGSINPISEIAKELSKYQKLVFHVDAAQAVGKIDLDYSNVDLLTFSSQKIHGLTNGGALLIKKNLELLPLTSGGGQEFGLRSGTVDVAGALSLVCALKKSIKDMDIHFNIVKNLAKSLYDYFPNNTNLFEINSNLINPYIINFSTLTKMSSVVVEALSSKGFLVSSTSACSSYKQKGSYVVKSLGKDENISNNTIRVSLSYLNTIEEMDAFIKTLNQIIGEIR